MPKKLFSFFGASRDCWSLSQHDSYESRLSGQHRGSKKQEYSFCFHLNRLINLRVVSFTKNKTETNGSRFPFPFPYPYPIPRSMQWLIVSIIDSLLSQQRARFRSTKPFRVLLLVLVPVTKCSHHYD